MEKKQMYADGKPFEPLIDLSGYVEKEPGKGLSEHDFSSAYKGKLDGVEEGAQRNTVTGIKGDFEEAYRTGNINITKDNLGLTNVENKSSRQIREEITKEDVEASLGYTPEIAGAYQNATAYTDVKVAELIGGAPETMDTLKEVADAIKENKTVADALDAAIGRKANQTELDTHTGNSNIHITTSEREKWNATAEKIGTVTGITDSPEVSDSHILASSKAVHQVFQSVSNGKSLIASAITDRGIVTPADAEFQTMADNIRNLSKSTGNAGAAQVLAGYTFSNASGTGFTGTMKNCGAVSQTLNAGGAYVIPAGYHNGSGRVSVNSLASQTSATAAAGNITAGKTAWVNGIKVTGTGADNTANYNAGVAAADARANPSSANYKAGYNAGHSVGYNAGVTAADNRANVNSVNYKTGYNNGVRDADNRANPASANYKAGYNAGYAAGQKSGQLKKVASRLRNISFEADYYGKYAHRITYDITGLGLAGLTYEKNFVISIVNFYVGQAEVDWSMKNGFYDSHNSTRLYLKMANQVKNYMDIDIFVVS